MSREDYGDMRKKIDYWLAVYFCFAEVPKWVQRIGWWLRDINGYEEHLKGHMRDSESDKTL